LGFAAKPCEAITIVREVVGENFQRDIAAKLCVLRAIHLSHAAGADRSDDFVRPEACAGDEGHFFTGASGGSRRLVGETQSEGTGPRRLIGKIRHRNCETQHLVYETLFSATDGSVSPP
jgi:hypothetical protein